MLNKPKFMSPSVNAYGNSVVDLNSETLPFSCVVDGNEAITKWQIVVSKLSNNEVVLDTGEVDLENPFYPINNRNQNVIFSINLKEYLSASEGKFINSTEPYYWTVSLFGEHDNTHSAEEVFYANSIPEIDIYYSYDNNFFSDEELNPELKLSDEENNISVLNKRRVFFKADYNQAESISIKRYGWRLTDINSDAVIIDTITKKQIYGVKEKILCEYNGLVNNTNYLIELYIETINGYFEIVKSVNFKVDYEVKDIEAEFDIQALNNTSGIMLNWGNLKTTEGTISGVPVNYIAECPVQNTSVVEIPENSQIIFSNSANGKGLNIDENSYVILSFQLDKDKDAILFEMSGVDEYSNIISRELAYISFDKILRYTIRKGNIISTHYLPVEDLASEVCWYVATLHPLIMEGTPAAEMELNIITANGGLYPSDIEDENAIYPSDDTYPSFGEWDKIREEEN